MNSWEAGTTYTPESGLGSAFKWGLNSSMPQGLSQKGWNGVGAGLKAFGQSQMGAGGLGGSAMFQNPGMAFASGLNNSQRLRQFSPPQGAFGQQGGGMQQQMAPIFNLKGLFGG